MQRSNHGGWQSTWDLHQWGGAPIQKVLTFGRAVVEEVTVDRAGKQHPIAWRVNSWANVNRQGHGNQFHTHPGALWSASYYVDDGGVGADRRSAASSRFKTRAAWRRSCTRRI